MVEPLLHVFIPLALLFVFFPRCRKEAVLLLPLTILPDVGFFLGSHRAALGNVFSIIIIALFVYIIALCVKKYYPKMWRGHALSERAILWISLFYLFSHLLLDLGWPGTALFWPLYPKLIGLNFNLYLNPHTFLPSAQIETLLKPLGEVLSVDQSPYFTTTGLLIVVVIVVAIVAKLTSGKLLFFHRKSSSSHNQLAPLKERN
tara:strand:- start:135 stop:743 length:609 start_codon:yes stop_codon:yes gene_type:complete